MDLRGCSRDQHPWEGEEGSRTGQRENLSWSTVPHGLGWPELGWLFRVCPYWVCCAFKPVYPPVGDAGHPARGPRLGRGDSFAKVTPEGG